MENFLKVNGVCIGIVFFDKKLDNPTVKINEEDTIFIKDNNTETIFKNAPKDLIFSIKNKNRDIFLASFENDSFSKEMWVKPKIKVKLENNLNVRNI